MYGPLIVVPPPLEALLLAGALLSDPASKAEARAELEEEPVEQLGHDIVALIRNHRDATVRRIGRFLKNRLPDS